MEAPEPPVARVVERIRALGVEDRPRTFAHGSVSVGLSRPREAPPGAVAVSLHRASPPLEVDEARGMLGAIAAEAGGVVLGEVLSRGPTHLAFLATPPEDAAGGGPPAPKAPDDRGDGEPSDGERPDDYFGPVTG